MEYLVLILSTVLTNMAPMLCVTSE